MRHILVSTMLAFIGGILLTAFMSVANATPAEAHMKQGCPPARHVTWKVPVDGGQPLHVVAGPAILHPWWNNGHPLVINKWWNSGVPPWDKDQKKVFIPKGQKYEILGAGGELWKYKPNRACNHNAKYHEIKNAPHLKRVWPWWLRQLGLFRRVAY